MFFFSLFFLWRNKQTSPCLVKKNLSRDVAEKWLFYIGVLT